MIDLHTHTVYSDGTSTVSDLLKLAEDKKLEVISITDHNTCAAYNELDNTDIRNLYSGEIIVGCEITTTYKKEVIEVLGYNMNLVKFQKMLSDNVLTFEQKQLKTFNLISNQLRKIGVTFDITNINFNPKKKSSVGAFLNEIKRYPENRKYFQNDAGWSFDSRFYRDELSNPKSKLFVDMSSLVPSLSKTVEIIHEAGGLAFLAHPFEYALDVKNELDEIIDVYKLDGLECYYTTFSNEQTDFLVDYCNRKGLKISGGSDFHGDNKINHNLGTGHGNLTISKRIIENW